MWTNWRPPLFTSFNLAWLVCLLVSQHFLVKSWKLSLTNFHISDRVETLHTCVFLMTMHNRGGAFFYKNIYIYLKKLKVCLKKSILHFWKISRKLQWKQNGGARYWNKWKIIISIPILILNIFISLLFHKKITDTNFLFQRNDNNFHYYINIVLK